MLIAVGAGFYYVLFLCLRRDQSSHKVDGKSGGGGGGGGGGSQVVDEEALHVDNAGGFLAKLRGRYTPTSIHCTA